MMEFVSWDDYSQYDGKVIIQPCSSHHQPVLNHQPHQSSSTIINPNHQSGNSKIEGENPIFDHNPIPILRNWRGFAAWKPPQNWIIFDEPNAILGFSPLILCGQTPCSFMETPSIFDTSWRITYCPHISMVRSPIFHGYSWFIRHFPMENPSHFYGRGSPSAATALRIKRGEIAEPHTAAMPPGGGMEVAIPSRTRIFEGKWYRTANNQLGFSCCSNRCSNCLIGLNSFGIRCTSDFFTKTHGKDMYFIGI